MSVMHPDPLEPGQEFSFAFSVYAVRYTGSSQSFYLPVGAEEYAKRTNRPRIVIRPADRLVVQEDAYPSALGTWSVLAWLPDNRGTVAFEQRLAYGVHQSIVPHYLRDSKQADALPVERVGWPAASPKSLAIQTRIISFWSGRSAQDGLRNSSALSRRRCSRLASMPLEKGLATAQRWLADHINDPATTLRERGFKI